MSCEIMTKSFEEIEEVRISCCNRNELLSLIDAMKKAIEQKLQKLNILIKHCDVYTDGKAILVHDRFGICADLISISEAFGLQAKQVPCSLRGKTYIINDPLLDYLRQLDQDLSFGEDIANSTVTDVVRKIMAANYSPSGIDSQVLAMVRNIMKNGEYVTTKTRTVTETFEDSYLVGRSESKWVSDESEARNKLMKLSAEAQATVNQANANLRDGTAKLIYARARQMGYSVQEIKKGTQVQLVLVRCE